MEFLALNETWAWCAAHGFGLTPNDRPEPPSASSHHSRLPYAEGQRSGREAEVAATCAEMLGRWDECLLWVIGWGVWPSSEDWPRYYAERGARGERRSLEEAPGHLFQDGEGAILADFLTQVLENAWDAYVLPAVSGGSADARAVVSHDEFVDIYTRESHAPGKAAR